MSLETLDRRVSALEARIFGTTPVPLETHTVVIGQLMWAKATSVDRLTFAAAESFCAGLRTDGHDDWRLPTIQELLSLVNYTRVAAFPDTKSAYYWSSSPDASAPAVYAWIVGFGGGRSYYLPRDNFAFVRAVRDVKEGET